MRQALGRLGLRGRLALSIGAIVVVAFGVVFVTVRARDVARGDGDQPARSRARRSRHRAAPDAERARGLANLADRGRPVRRRDRPSCWSAQRPCVAALLAGYLLAARTASPLRRFAATAAEVDAGDLSPRLDHDPASAAELRTLADAFNHMLDRLDATPSPGSAVRLRRLARASQPADRDPRTDRSARPRQAPDATADPPGRGDDADRDAPGRTAGRGAARAGPARRGRRAQRASSIAAAFLRGAISRRQRRGRGRALGELAPRARSTLDPDLIAQVVRNLLANARRHAGPDGTGGALLASRGCPRSISVDDDGPGIPTEQRERVFDRFHRSESLARSRLGRQRPRPGDRPLDRRAPTAARSGSRTPRSAGRGSASSCRACPGRDERSLTLRLGGGQGADRSILVRVSTPISLQTPAGQRSARTGCRRQRPPDRRGRRGAARPARGRGLTIPSSGSCSARTSSSACC